MSVKSVCDAVVSSSRPLLIRFVEKPDSSGFSALDCKMPAECVGHRGEDAASHLHSSGFATPRTYSRVGLRFFWMFA